MSDYTPTTETVESLGEDIQAYLVMDGVYLDHEITRNVARCILSDPDWAGVVAEEPEWEYGISSGHGSVNYVGTRESVDARVRSFEKAGAPLRHGEQIVRRRKVGLWVPVKQEGADDA